MLRKEFDTRLNNIVSPFKLRPEHQLFIDVVNQMAKVELDIRYDKDLSSNSPQSDLVVLEIKNFLEPFNLNYYFSISENYSQTPININPLAYSRIFYEFGDYLKVLELNKSPILLNYAVKQEQHSFSLFHHELPVVVSESEEFTLSLQPKQNGLSK